jgi:glycosidase
MTIGGIPLIYLGDELATLNDYSYRDDADKVDDSRWVHRPKFDWKRAASRTGKNNPTAEIFQGMQAIISLRKNNTAFSGHETEILDTGNDAVFGFLRVRQNTRVLVLANFSEKEQPVSANLLRLYGLGYKFTDLITGKSFSPVDFKMPAYQFVCLLAK